MISPIAFPSPVGSSPSSGWKRTTMRDLMARYWGRLRSWAREDGAPREASMGLLDLTMRKLWQAVFVTEKASNYKYKLMILESPNCRHSWHAGTSFFFWQCWNLFLFAANTWTICCDLVFMAQVFFFRCCNCLLTWCIHTMVLRATCYKHMSTPSDRKEVSVT
jgi:hypothetical protein